ncbi:MAG: YlbF family regulator [Bacilli bacterium]|nr:YlbF family regulator [Bacilli bacterium]
MNNQLNEKVLDLKTQLYEEEVVKEYLRLKKIFYENEELSLMRKEIATLYSLKKYEEHKKLKEEYENIPLVKNFYTLKEELYDLFKEIINLLDI